ncbi:MAG: hypothetical protein J6C86_07175 [Bacteroidaceae bacterium]|nr:hypothetical protein [Bacteroidaceae bacterium]
MRIKKVLVTFLLLCIFLQVKATGLSSDIIFLDGEEWFLMAKPINMDSVLYSRMMNFLPQNHCVTTANWEGYTAYWEVREGCLYLQHLEICVYDQQKKEELTLTYTPKQLKNLFSPYYKRGRIRAHWFNGELRAGKGNLLRYVHSGFKRNMETEQVMTLRQGKIQSVQKFHNSKCSGINLLQSQDEITKRFPWCRFPEYKGQRLIFNIGKFQCTADGKLLDFDVHSVFARSKQENIKESNHLLVEAFKETLKSIYPWEVLLINGKLMVEPQNCVLVIEEK